VLENKQLNALVKLEKFKITHTKILWNHLGTIKAEIENNLKGDLIANTNEQLDNIQKIFDHLNKRDNGFIPASKEAYEWIMKNEKNFYDNDLIKPLTGATADIRDIFANILTYISDKTKDIATYRTPLQEHFKKIKLTTAFGTTFLQPYLTILININDQTSKDTIEKTNSGIKKLGTTIVTKKIQ